MSGFYSRLAFLAVAYGVAMAIMYHSIGAP